MTPPDAPATATVHPIFCKTCLSILSSSAAFSSASAVQIEIIEITQAAAASDFFLLHPIFSTASNFFPLHPIFSAVSYYFCCILFFPLLPIFSAVSHFCHCILFFHCILLFHLHPVFNKNLSQHFVIISTLFTSNQPVEDISKSICSDRSSFHVFLRR